MSFPRLAAGLLLVLALPRPAPAQAWNTDAALRLVDRAVTRRSSLQVDSGLRSFRARAHGFVFFLGQLGEGFREPPRLIRSDQLELEVYWRAPGASKQIIVGRRDRRDLPTDIQYHRDHLGIVQNNFGDSIRLGEGDEVRDVPHPLAPVGPDLYEYALTDSLTITLPDRAVRVYQVPVRPREFDAPRVAGTMYIDVDRAELVRFEFNFTPAAYRDDTVEDIVVVLENGLWFGQYWLPRRQEIEIRRRTSWLDLPARGIIRGRWEIGGYQFNVPLDPGLFVPGAPEIVNAPPAQRDSARWDKPLDQAIRAALGPVQAADLESVRGAIERAVANRALTGLSRSRPSWGSLSDVLHVNRVEGLTPGLGWVLRPGDRRVEIGVGASYGTSDERPKGRLSVTAVLGAWTLEVRAARQLRDVGSEPVIAPVLNSLLAQERGVDYGDYVLLDRAAVGLGRRLSGRTTARLELAMERPRSVGVTASPAAGQYRSNPPLGGPAWGVARLAVGWRPAGLAAPLDYGLRTEVEGGHRPGADYLRLRAVGEITLRTVGGEWQGTATAGWGSAQLPAYREFFFGGRGTLPGEVFRAWGGRQVVTGRLEWRVPALFPALPLGAFGNTGSRAVVAPFVAAGWAGGSRTGAPWNPSGAVRAVGGIGVELFHRLLRLDVATSLRDGGLVVLVDVRRDLWSVL